jgi:dTMP kinase
MRSNPFIVFEGIDGSGKSTQIRLLEAFLTARGHKVLRTAEPSDGPAGKLIRQVFSGAYPADDRVVAGLFVADRLEHILHAETGMRKALDEGFTVLCDRYYLSSYAYQGVHMPLEWVMQANSLAASLLKPDLHIYLDLAPEKALERIRKGREDRELYETMENLSKVHALYAQLIQELIDSENILRVDADRNTDKLHAQIIDSIKKAYPIFLD